MHYGTGLRANEVISLKVTDIDSQRMTLRVEQGKGGKDRYAMISPVLLERLRVWWRVARAQGKMLDGGWLFPGLNPINPLTARQLNRAIHEALMFDTAMLSGKMDIFKRLLLDTGKIRPLPFFVASITSF